jgi:hypothetical protein
MVLFYFNSETLSNYPELRQASSSRDHGRSPPDGFQSSLPDFNLVLKGLFFRSGYFATEENWGEKIKWF